MFLKPVFRPLTHLELSLAECHLTGAGIPYYVHNRYTFGIDVFPRIASYNDCGVFVHPDLFYDAAEILAPMARDLEEFNATIGTKVRILIEGYCGEFSPLATLYRQPGR